MRYFFADELRARVARWGLQLAALSGFPEMRLTPSHETWNVLAVATASEQEATFS